MSKRPTPGGTSLVAFVALLLGCGAPTEGGDADDYEELAEAITYSGDRIAMDVDGNQHDPDDWASTPMALALLARRGLQGNLVHFSYNDHLGASSGAMAAEETTSVQGAISRFNYPSARFFDCQTNLAGAVTNLKSQINASSSSDPLYIIAAGPMEVIWRAGKAANAARRAHVTVISHSNWNNTHEDTSQLNHTRQDIEALGMKWIQINTQSALCTRYSGNGCPDYFPAADANWQPYAWLKDASDARLRWVYGRMLATGKPDVSDAGMTYFLLTNDQGATPTKLEAFFGNWVQGGGADEN